jgi:hypothetical protein
LTATVWVDGTLSTFTDGVDWTCFAAADTNTCAENLKLLVDALASVVAVRQPATAYVGVYNQAPNTYHRYVIGGTMNDASCGSITASTQGNVNTYGNQLFNPTNTYDIGAVAATKPKVVYAGTGFDSDGDYYADGWYRVNTTDTGLIQNTAGANVVVAPGRHTGTNQAGDTRLWGYPTYRAGTSAHIQADRYYIRSGAKPLTEGAPIDIARISFPASTVSYSDLIMTWAMACYDGTDVKLTYGRTVTGAVQEADDTITADAVTTTISGAVESGGAAITAGTFTFTGGVNVVTIATNDAWDCNFGGATTWFEISYTLETNPGQYLTITAL